MFILYEPSAVVDVTLLTVATIPSTTKALFAPKEPDSPGLGSVRVAALPAASFTVPLFSARALVDV